VLKVQNVSKKNININDRIRMPSQTAIAAEGPYRSQATGSLALLRRVPSPGRMLDHSSTGPDAVYLEMLAMYCGARECRSRGCDE
jgi:hypothetical protein